ncbi:hypothetical protein G647_09918 [Cladophialophora carrionii CBS 160.54]|uniref:Uncharacterized protein n=1 Tax=Cladophialophora carrionii CBS 160.54 TaxID=1279043 RepID=V9DK45_9EURO|nr:uncharacterized protein G647_09918 [Cladophialophora carrionii CBS 160.54]ETI27235.1 hypothetical protein G647_09918 [Cladophialophora carrionii CBS 160.54]
METMDEDDRADRAISSENNKHSKRDRLKGALARTKSKFKKENERPKEAELPDDVNDFLAAGKASTSSAGRSFPQRSTVTPIDEQSSSPTSTRPSTSDSFANSFAAQRSPRKISVPKIDVSNAQRWPRAQSVGTTEQDINDFLRPEYQARSQSASSFSTQPKKKGRGRKLSVSFNEAPPVIIGEGGDDAPTPPVEIGKARQRARSASPVSRRGQHPPGGSMDGTYGKRPSPAPPPAGQVHAPPDVLRPRMMQRVQTGFAVDSIGTSGLDKEFEMTLRVGETANSPASRETPEIIAPRPVRIVQPPPAVFEESAESQIVKKEPASPDLREQFREGDALRMHLDKEGPDVVDEIRQGRPVRRGTTQDKQEPSNWF